MRLLRGVQVVMVAWLLSCSSGCLVVHTRERVIREDEPRRRVRFSSSRAQRDFQAAALDPKRRSANESSNMLAIPFVMLLSNSTKLSDNAYYNDQLADCDSDGDGLVSDDEVLAYRDLKSRTPIDPSRSPAAIARRGPAIDIEVPSKKKRIRLAMFDKKRPPQREPIQVRPGTGGGGTSRQGVN